MRLSYVKNSAGVLQVMDSNDYYPFGMSFLKPFGQSSVYDPMAIPYNYKYNGKELQETGMYDYGARMYMPDIGRWGQHDPLSEITLDPFGYVYNNPLSYNDPTGMEGENVATENGGDPPVKGASFGGGKYDGGVKSFGLGSDGNLDTEITQLNMNSKTSSPSSGSFGLGGGGSGRSGNKYGNLEEYRTWRDYQGYHKNESWFDHFCRMVNSNHMDIMRDEGSGGGLMYGGFNNVVETTINNPIPSTLSRGIPAHIEGTTLGAPGASEVFVTAAADIKGLNAAQIAERLTIPQSSTGFKVINFKTPKQGIATPYVNESPGFVGYGKTAGGAREFVIPNQVIPKNANIKVVK